MKLRILHLAPRKAAVWVGDLQLGGLHRNPDSATCWVVRFLLLPGFSYVLDRNGSARFPELRQIDE